MGSITFAVIFMLTCSLSFLVLLACCDYQFHLIPKRLNFLALGAMIPAVGLTGILWAVGIFFLYVFLFRLSRGGLGYGDVRLSPLGAVVLPEATPISAHLLAWMIAGGIALLLIRERQKRLPFAPAIFSSIILLKFLY